MFNLYAGKANLKGNLLLKPVGLTGDGIMKLDLAEVSSNFFSFNSSWFKADTANLSVFDNSNNLAFSAKNLRANIDILDPIYDLSKLFHIRQECSFYVHGHSAGGTNPSLVEMMHFNKNIFAFDCNYNRATTEDKARFFSNVNELINGIAQEHSVSNANKMSEIAERRYTWNIVKQQYFDLFISNSKR